MSGLLRPRHPSLDDVRRSQHHSRSYPQLPSDGRSANGFPNHEDADEESLWGMFTFGVTGVIAIFCAAGLVTLLTVLYVVVRPFSKRSYRRLAAQLGAASFLEAISLLLPNTRIFLSGDSDVPSPVGTSLLVSNHLMDADWWAILMLGRCVGLRGSLKVFLRLLQPSRRQSSGRFSSNGTSTRLDQPVCSSPSKSVSFSRSAAVGGSFGRVPVSPEVSIVARLLHILLEFPLLSGENNKDYISDREELFQLLRSFAEDNGNSAPVHLLLFPEGGSLYDNGSLDRKAVLAMSNEFAKREGRPQLKHLLLPRTTGFNASLESLREASPVVYDVTMAFIGYEGMVPSSLVRSLTSLWWFLRFKLPPEIHIRIRRYSMEEVLQDAAWLDKQWSEKDRLLSHFARHQSFPTDSRGFCRHRVFDTRRHGFEGSILSLLRLVFVPCTVPFLLLLSVPMFWTGLLIWLTFRLSRWAFPDFVGGPRMSATSHDGGGATQTPGSAGGVDSSVGTPYFPATPFVSPSVTSWRNSRRDPRRAND